jgi:hypothetical protein
LADFFVSLGNAVVDRSPDELIGAVIVAFALSLAMAGVFCVGRRSARENVMPVIVLVLVANLVSMAVGAGYLAHLRGKRGEQTNGSRQTTVVGHEVMWTEAIFQAADVNRDGRLSSEEASLAAAAFVRRADETGTGAIDARSLCDALVGTSFHVREWSRVPPAQLGGNER